MSIRTTEWKGSVSISEHCTDLVRGIGCRVRRCAPLRRVAPDGGARREWAAAVPD